MWIFEGGQCNMYTARTHGVMPMIMEMKNCAKRSARTMN